MAEKLIHEMCIRDRDEAFLQESAGRAAAFVEKLTGATERVLQAVKPELEKNCQARS